MNNLFTADHCWYLACVVSAVRISLRRHCAGATHASRLLVSCLIDRRTRAVWLPEGGLPPEAWEFPWGGTTPVQLTPAVCWFRVLSTGGRGQCGCRVAYRPEAWEFPWDGPTACWSSWPGMARATWKSHGEACRDPSADLGSVRGGGGAQHGIPGYEVSRVPLL